MLSRRLSVKEVSGFVCDILQRKNLEDCIIYFMAEIRGGSANIVHNGGCMYIQNNTTSDMKLIPSQVHLPQ